MLSTLQYKLLSTLYPRSQGDSSGRTGETAYLHKSKITALLGHDFLPSLTGKSVIDFGCGEGTDAVAMATHAARVTGIDIRDDALARARQKALAANVHDRCVFLSGNQPAPSTHTEIAHADIPQPNLPQADIPQADIVVSVDAFEHFHDPAHILTLMERHLKPHGEIHLSFGPTWFHPRGGHLFSIFPWAHILLTERALIRWRSTFKADGATRFHEVEGGLNQMTIARFEQLIAASPFTLAAFELVPIRPLRLFHNRLTREFTTAIVRCRLVRKSESPAAATTASAPSARPPASRASAA